MAMLLVGRLPLMAETTATQSETTTMQSGQTSVPDSGTSSAPTAKEAGTSVTLPSGVVYKDLTIGTGRDITSATQISMHYILTLANGTVADSSRTRLVP